MDKKEVLKDYGLSKNEIEVYLKLLEIRYSTGANIAKLTKLFKANAYDALRRLAKKGLATYFTKNKVKYFQAVDPEQILTNIKEKEIKVQQILPELKTIQLGAKSPSFISMSEGTASVRKSLMDMITDTKEVYVLGAPKDLVKIVGEGWINYEWHKIRISWKVKLYHIVNEDYPLHRIKLIRDMKYTTIKFLPKKYGAPNATIINDKGIAMIFLHPLQVVQIDGEEVSRSFKHYFKMLYKSALPYSPREKSNQNIQHHQKKL